MALITTNQIFNDHLQKSVEVSQPETYQRLISEDQRQFQREQQYLASDQTQRFNQIVGVRDQLGNLDTNKFRQIIRYDFYNPDVMTAATTITDAIIYTQPSELRRIKNWIQNLQPLDVISTEGYILRGSLRSANDLFIVKVPKVSSTQSVEEPSDTLWHEYFVGTFGTNKLRALDIPNFAYIYGRFQCSPPITDNRSVVAWCNKSKPAVNYLLYENITPAITMRQYVASCTFNQFLNKYLQVLLALSKANEVIDFTHYDLHDENVLIRQVQQEFYIQYDKLYLLTDAVATIIDYGKSHIVYDGQHFGDHFLSEYGVFPDHSFPLHDAYKFLLMSMQAMINAGNYACFQGAARILTFFNDRESAYNIVRKQAVIYYYLPWMDKVKDKKIKELIDYIRYNIPTNFLHISPENKRVLGCQGTDLCLPYQQIIRNLGLTQKIRVTTIFDFYDVVTRLVKEARMTEIQDIVDNFNYYDHINEPITRFNQLAGEIRMYPRIVRLRRLSVSQILTPDMLQQYQKFLIGLAKVYDQSQELIELKDTITYTAAYYDEVETPKELDAVYNSVISVVDPYVAEAKLSIRQDMEYLDRLRRERDLEYWISKKPEYEWYWKGIKSYDYLIY